MPRKLPISPRGGKRFPPTPNRRTRATIAAADGAVLAILLLAQATPAAPAPPPSVFRPDASRFDLAKLPPRPDGCADIDYTSSDVVVCARMADMPRSLAEQALIFEPKPFRPTTKMLGGEGSVRGEQRSTIMGSAPAAMATFKLRF